MKLKTIHLIGLVAFVFLFGIPKITFACSIHILPEIWTPESALSKYIFVGEVTGYTDEVSDNEKFRGVARGLRLRPASWINLPEHSDQVYELFYFRHDSDCFPTGTIARPPLGTRVIVVANDQRKLPLRNDTGQVRIEVSSKGHGRTAIVGKDFELSSETIFDFENYNINWNKAGNNEKVLLQLQMKAGIAADALRLSKSSDPDQRFAVFERLLHAPFIDFPSFVNKKLGNSYRLLNLTLGSQQKVELSDREKKILEEWWKLQGRNSIFRRIRVN